MISNWHEGGRYEQFLNVMRYDIVMNRNGEQFVLGFVFISDFFLDKNAFLWAKNENADGK